MDVNDSTVNVKRTSVRHVSSVRSFRRRMLEMPRANAANAMEALPTSALWTPDTDLLNCLSCSSNLPQTRSETITDSASMTKAIKIISGLTEPMLNAGWICEKMKKITKKMPNAAVSCRRRSE